MQVCYEYVAEQGRELYELVRNVIKFCQCWKMKHFLSRMFFFFFFLSSLRKRNYLYLSWTAYLLFLKVAHLPDKANNYLTPALSVLEKNTWPSSKDLLLFPKEASPKGWGLEENTTKNGGRRVMKHIFSFVFWEFCDRRLWIVIIYGSRCSPVCIFNIHM